MAVASVQRSAARCEPSIERASQKTAVEQVTEAPMLTSSTAVDGDSPQARAAASTRG